jgi:hypothetical protein
VQFKVAEVAMKLDMLAATIALIVCSVPGGKAQTAQAPCCKDGRLIAHIEHDGLSFSIKIDAVDDRFLLISIPRRTGSYTRSSLPPVHLKVLTMGNAQMRGNIQMRETNPPIEGPAELVPGTVSMGGWDDIDYRFALQRHTVVDDIHSVTISIGDQTYTAMPF